ncbi:dTDP-4-dehydrorhamnose reductase [Sphingomonas sp. TREG-RG-20F-R18-01]|uniref:dTDP-4-dehydrorhamnose reductase n=1 Tax=Sphingomonas sp. TREG-RG-20F-R18-01 TaxID=2914982 RepID=UPI001F568A1F|nr:dTDP-4-dehydrorhamnose reductase [Sphingomonas sp. TREG-RG-20F-R18-01]
MKALIVGAGGQLGHALLATAPEGVEIVTCDQDTVDITDAQRVAAFVAESDPDVIFNAAAYTAVDKAESDAERAQAVNADAVGFLAAAARAAQAKLVHVSTDFVFDGAARHPYAPDAAPAPLGVYGRTKLAGERAAGPDALVVRTAWLYGPVGGNFVRTMLRLMQAHPQVRVVADQIGCPTYAPALAAALWAMAGQDATGVYHFSDGGEASWFDFAVAIQEEAMARGLFDTAVPIIPITTAEYPTPAQRPAYSVLDCRATYALLGHPATPWRENLHIMIEEIHTHG